MKKTFVLLLMSALVAGTSCGQQKQSEPAQPQAQTATQPAENYKVKSIAPTVAGDAILNSITADYKGKVTLIDFWATWCGPCRRAMTEIDSIKPELIKRGVQFVYVTGETSPEATWQQMIRKIDGDHYRLTKQQWDDLCSRLQIPGIPSYMLLGKDGSVAYSNLTEGGYPGNELIKAEIEKALNAGGK